MKYEIQTFTNNDWHPFAMADRFCIAWEIVDCQQKKYKFLPDMQFRIVELFTGKISVV
jgi:hypothetical protein